MFVRLLACSAIAIASIGSPAIAADTAQSEAAAPKKALDPNERICETVSTLGSRLSKKRFCGTRAEWDAKRLRDRQEVERAQMSPCVNQTTGATGRPSC